MKQTAIFPKRYMQAEEALRMAVMLAAMTGFWYAAIAAGEAPPVTGSRICLVDGKEVKNDLHVDIAGVRLYACSEECLKKLTEKEAYVRLVEKSGRDPEQIPIHRSRQRTDNEVLEGMVLIKGGEFARRGRFFARRARRPEPVEHDGYRVQVSSFYMDKYEVTYQQYCEFLNDGNEKYVTGGIRRDKKGQFAPP